MKKHDGQFILQIQDPITKNMYQTPPQHDLQPETQDYKSSTTNKTTKQQTLNTQMLKGTITD